MSDKYPTLQFGEITVKYEDSWIKQAFRYFNYDTKIDPTSNIIILFHSTNDVISSVDIVPDKTLVYATPLSDSIHPQTISIIADNPIKLYKRNETIDANHVIYLKGFSYIHSNQHKNYFPDPSIYNCIYYVADTNYPDLERVVFSLMKRKYGVDSSRFLFSYDPDVITKKQVENIIYKLLTGW
jgi:hypothetical protein